jgi:tetratricopeptide (TPR) repeat protein
VKCPLRPLSLAVLLGAYSATAMAVEEVKASGGVAAGGDIRDSTITITHGLTPEEVKETMLAIARQESTAHAKLQELSQKLQTTEGALIGFFRILEETDVPLERLPAKLEEIARRHKDTLQRMAALAVEDPEIEALVGQARGAVDRGDYDRANALLTRAEETELAAIERAEAVMNEAQEAVRRRRLSAAAVRAEQGGIAMTRLRYREAADHFRAAANLVPAAEGDTRAAYLDRHANALYTEGNEQGANAALGQAIALYRQLLEARTRERVPLGWAMTQNNLGDALLRLGEREAGTAQLEEAVAAYREALKERTRERVPLAWAMTQNNLGNALWRLGEREAGTARLEEAVAAYREALKERTRERVPLDWAATQNNLGSALHAQGMRTRGEAGQRLAAQALGAYRKALEVFTPAAQAPQWLQTQGR